MDEVIECATAAARTDLPVLITGPSGTGKQTTGRAIHAWSDRASSPLVAVACAALPEGLAAREIFGCTANVHPALPGDHQGALSQAGSGVVLLTNVERLPAPILSTLFGALRERSFKREGESNEQPLRARIIATAEGTTDPPLGQIPHHEIRVPGLDERSEDVLPLAAHFLTSFAREQGLQAVGFTADARDYLAAESWAGNVREVRERVRQAVQLAGSGAISAEALMLAADGEDVPSFKEAKRAFETRYVVGLLRRCRGNISRAARLAKKDRKDFYDVIRRTGVNPTEFRH